MQKITVIDTKRLPGGQLVRLQQRGKAFDVLRNSTGYCWTYVHKAVPEEYARTYFDILTLEACQ